MCRLLEFHMRLIGCFFPHLFHFSIPRPCPGYRLVCIPTGIRVMLTKPGNHSYFSSFASFCLCLGHFFHTFRLLGGLILTWTVNMRVTLK
jgi:hypothetical protein